MLFKNIKTLVAVAVMLLGTPAFASHIVTVNETFASGAVFNGTLTFSNDYLALESGTGTMSGGPYGTIVLNQTWFGGVAGTPLLAGELGHDWLLDGPASGVFGTDYYHFLGFAWQLSGGNFALLPESVVGAYNSGFTDKDGNIESFAAATLSVDTPVPVGRVPEPGIVMLLGAGLAALIGARRRKRA